MSKATRKLRHSEQMESGVLYFVANIVVKGKSIKDLTHPFTDRLDKLVDRPVKIHPNGWIL